MAEKKLEIVNVRMGESLFNTVDALANSLDMSRSEWICGVIEAAVQKERQQYVALHSIFGHEAETSKESSVFSSNTNRVLSELSDRVGK